MVKRFKIGHKYKFKLSNGDFFIYKVKKIKADGRVKCEMIKQRGFAGWDNKRIIPMFHETIGPNSEEIFNPKTITRFTSKNGIKMSGKITKWNKK